MRECPCSSFESKSRNNEINEINGKVYEGDEIKCIDIHTHIIPDEWPNWCKKFGPLTDFLTIQKTSEVFLFSYTV